MKYTKLFEQFHALPVREAVAKAAEEYLAAREKFEAKSHKRTQHVVYHLGEVVEMPLTRFIRNRYPKSKAAKILANPGKSPKSVVGA